MKRFLSLLALAVALLSARVVRAQQYPLGSVAAEFPFTPARLVADPARDRVYATVQATNSVVVIDTTTLQVIATIPIGSSPTDMAISMDGTTLYVVNTGSTLAAVGIIDLDTLTTRPSFSLAGSPIAIAAGLNGHVYVSASSSFESSIYQIDGTTGAVQAQFNTNAYDNDLFQISPDGTRLFVASTGTEPGSLESFDVSTDTPAALQSNSQASENDSQLVISHNGKYLCLPSGGGNPGAGNYSTFLFSTADITQHYGSFANGAYPGPLAFSPDDSVAYQTRSGTGLVIDAFSTTTFFANMEVNLPTIGSQGYPDEVNAIVTDRTGSYLFVAESSFDGTATDGQLAVLTTGTGTLIPSSVLPVITSSLSATGTQNTPFTYQITASGTPTSYNAYSYDATGNTASALPAGLSVDTVTGLISGTPTSSGYFYITISASNASGTASASLTLNISYTTTSSPPVVTTTSLPDGVVGQPYSATITATNSPIEFDSNGLPAGLTLNESTGTISGTPTASGVFNVLFTVYNDYSGGSATLSLTIDAAPATAPVITNAASAAGAVGTPFSFQIVATGSPSGYTATGLPAGLGVNPKTGLISGTPSAAGQFAVILGATNAVGTTNAAFLLTISGTTVMVPVVTSGTASGMVGVPFTYQIVAANAPTSYGLASLSGNTLPAGLVLDTGTGLISGMPTAAGTFNLTLTASNAGGTGRGALALTITPAVAPVLTSAATATASANQAFSYQITASGTPTSFGAGNLPPGLSVNTVTGLISGTPTVTGVYSVVLSATNASGTGSSTLLLTVNSVLPVIDVVATVPRVTAGSGDHAQITISRTGDLSQKLIVAYAIKGSARNGTDYVTISGKQKIKPNKASSTIQIIPTDGLSGNTLVVKVTLLPAESYQIGTATKAKVKIVP